ncbi:MAG: hypothetical protein AAGJ81_08025 [Verrucomicrobiota bacterium]
MKKLTVILFAVASSTPICAMDWVFPETISYEWTVQTAFQGRIPKFTAKDAPISQLIRGLGDGMTSTLEIKALGMDEAKLEKRLTFERENVAWIEVVALIADEINADILITKGGVILMPATLENEKAEPNDADSKVNVPGNPFNLQKD